MVWYDIHSSYHANQKETSLFCFVSCQEVFFGPKLFSFVDKTIFGKTIFLVKTHMLNDIIDTVTHAVCFHHWIQFMEANKWIIMMTREEYFLQQTYHPIGFNRFPWWFHYNYEIMLLVYSRQYLITVCHCNYMWNIIWSSNICSDKIVSHKYVPLDLDTPIKYHPDAVAVIWWLF